VYLEKPPNEKSPNEKGVCVCVLGEDCSERGVCMFEGVIRIWQPNISHSHTLSPTHLTCQISLYMLSYGRAFILLLST
jgi:hypothetical protein